MARSAADRIEGAFGVDEDDLRIGGASDGVKASRKRIFDMWTKA
jgi:hypothetical protein